MAPRYRVTLTVEERSELKALTRAATKTHRQAVPVRTGSIVVRPRVGGAGMDRGPGGRGAGRLSPHGRALETAVCGAGSGVRLGAQAAGAAAAGSHLRRRFEARLVALACSQAPPEALDPAPAGGESSGTGLGRAGVGDDGAADAKKNQLQPHRKKYWRIPPRGSAAFVACMEDVLEVYARAYHPRGRWSAWMRPTSS